MGCFEKLIAYYEVNQVSYVIALPKNAFELHARLKQKEAELNHCKKIVRYQVNNQSAVEKSPFVQRGQIVIPFDSLFNGMELRPHALKKP